METFSVRLCVLGLDGKVHFSEWKLCNLKITSGDELNVSPTQCVSGTGSRMRVNMRV